jgi:hypothetical protein
VDSLVLQTVIGLLFVFASFAALVSVTTEAISRLIGLRGEYLLRGLRSLLDGTSHFELTLADLLRRTPGAPAPGPAQSEPATTPWVTTLLAQPLISSMAEQAAMPPSAGNAKLTNRQRRRMPSYLSSRTFSMAMIGMLVPDSTGRTTMDDVSTAVAAMPDGHLKTSMQSVMNAAGSDLESFRIALQQWYDDHMARVSGWYKRHVRWISLVIATVLVVSFNLSAVQITRSLYTDQVLTSSVVTTATQASGCQDEDPAHCLRNLRREVERVGGAGLPIGWSVVADCRSTVAANCGWAAGHGLADPARGTPQDILFFLLVLLGWALMVVAILPGARFWFDALNRLGSLRASGPKPVSS